MRERRLAVAVVCLAVSSLAWSQGPQGTVTGMVRVASGSPLPQEVNVSLRSMNQPPMPPKEGEFVLQLDTTPYEGAGAAPDSQGRFAMKVPPGEYVLTVWAPGYFDREGGVGSGLASVFWGRPVRVRGNDVQTLNIVLDKGAAIEGTVTLADGRPGYEPADPAQGNPVAGFDVEVEREDARGVLNPFGGSAHTDERGRYRIDSLPPGRYVVFTATSVGWWMRFAPGVARASAARHIDVHPGEIVRGVDIAQTGGTHVVRGKVDLPANVDTQGTTVCISPGRLGEWPDCRPLAPDRTFRFEDLPDDTYTVRFSLQAQGQVVGMTADGKGLRERIIPPAFGTAEAEVRVAGADAGPVTLAPPPAK